METKTPTLINKKLAINESASKNIPWHSPKVKRLTVVLDTSYSEGSGADGSGGTAVKQPKV